MKQDFFTRFRSLMKKDDERDTEYIVTLLDKNIDLLNQLTQEDIRSIFSFNSFPYYTQNIENCELILETKCSFELNNKQQLLSILNHFACIEFMRVFTDVFSNQANCKVILGFLCNNSKLMSKSLSEDDIHALLNYRDKLNNTILDLLFSESNDQDILLYGNNCIPILSLIVDKGVFDVKDTMLENPYRKILVDKVPDIIHTVNPVQKLPIIKYLFQQNMIPQNTIFPIWYNEIHTNDIEFSMDLRAKFKIDNTIVYRDDFYRHVHEYPDVIQGLYSAFSLKFTGNVPHIKFSDPTWGNVLLDHGFIAFCQFASAMSSNPLNATDAAYKAMHLLQDPDIRFFADYDALECLVEKIENLVSEYDSQTIEYLKSCIELNYIAENAEIQYDNSNIYDSESLGSEDNTNSEQ